MYNEELKTRFIRDYTASINTANACETLFDMIGKIEEELGTDVCMMDAQNLQYVVDKITGIRARGKWNRIVYLRDYIKWCFYIAKVKDSKNVFSKIDTEGISQIKKWMVRNPKHLQKYLDEIFSPESANTIENIYRCYFWMAFMGVAEKDIVTFSSSNVDLSKQVIIYNGMELPIYRESLTAFKKCVELTEFIYIHPNYSKEISRQRISGDCIFRGFRSSVGMKSMRVEISQRTKEKEEELGMRLSYYRVWLSGVFYRMYEDELAGEEPNFIPIMIEEYKSKQDNPEDDIDLTQTKYKQALRDYMLDYNRWKFAFNV